MKKLKTVLWTVKRKWRVWCNHSCAFIYLLFVRKLSTKGYTYNIAAAALNQHVLKLHLFIDLF